MKDFTDVLIDAIIEQEQSRIDKIMDDVTRNISKDFAQEAVRLIDAYYDNYTPVHYVRVYGKKRKLKTKSGSTSRKPRAGQVSLHAAIAREGKDSIAYYGLDTEGNYVGGIRLDANKLKGNGMRHIGKGISEWDIIENFIYAGEKEGSGDWRAQIDYGYPSADKELLAFSHNYRPTLDKHFEAALKKFS